jgi:hypothetical protein
MAASCRGAKACEVCLSWDRGRLARISVTCASAERMRAERPRSQSRAPACSTSVNGSGTIFSCIRFETAIDKKERGSTVPAAKRADLGSRERASIRLAGHRGRFVGLGGVTLAALFPLGMRATVGPAAPRPAPARPQIFSLARLRRLVPLLLGLFLWSQVAGLVPLISVHIQHAFETEQDVAADLSEGSSRNHVHHHHARHDGQHEHGSSDPGDQCCTLHHHLAGVVPIAGSADRSGLTAQIVTVPPLPLVSTGPGPLERPPKLPSSI